MYILLLFNSKCYWNNLYKLKCDIYRVNNIIYTSTSSDVSKFYYSNNIIYYTSLYITMYISEDIDELISSERDRIKVKRLW